MWIPSTYTHPVKPIQIVPNDNIEKFEPGLNRHMKYAHTCNLIINLPETDADEIASWLVEILSFAQNRWIYIGKRISATKLTFKKQLSLDISLNKPEFIPLRWEENGKDKWGYDNRSYISNAIDQYYILEPGKVKTIKIVIHMLLLSKTDTFKGLKYFYIFSALEMLSQIHYHQDADDIEIEEIITSIQTLIKINGNSLLKKHRKKLKKKFIFEPRIYDKMKKYLKSLDTAIYNKETRKILNEAPDLRNNFVHLLNDDEILNSNGHCIYLGITKILQVAILREIGINRTKEIDLFLIGEIKDITSRNLHF